MVVELADFGRSIPAKVFLKLALFRDLIAEIAEVERLDLACYIVEDGDVWILRRGAENVAV